MKTAKWIFGMLLAGMLVLVGCSKSPTEEAPAEKSGINFDKLTQTLPLDAQATINGIKMQLRYGMYDQAIKLMDDFSKNNTLTDDQKATVKDIIEQIKQEKADAAAKKGDGGATQ